MISSKFMNAMFSALATLVTRQTGKNVQFDQIEPGQEMEAVYKNITKFSKDVIEAFDNSEMKVLGVLEPGKIYCLQIDMSKARWELIDTLAECLGEQDIRLVVIDKDMNFISIPNGYEIIKKEGKN